LKILKEIKLNIESVKKLKYRLHGIELKTVKVIFSKKNNDRPGNLIYCYLKYTTLLSQ